jgi:plasmid stability protein
MHSGGARVDAGLSPHPQWIHFESISEVVMPINLSIKDVPDDLAQRLRERAARNHRSLQGELMVIIEQAAPASPPASPAPTAPVATPLGGQGTPGWKTIEQIVAERAQRPPLNFSPNLPRGVDIIRGDRDSR